MSWDIAFHSGMSSDADMRGCINADAPIGVVAGLLNNQKLFLSLPRYMDRGGKVFVDSGAFTAFRKKEAIDWERVLSAYRYLIGSTSKPENLSIVAPDVVGNQEATLALWHKHNQLIRDWISSGVRVILPLQTGTLRAYELLAQAINLLGTDRVTAGIPSNLAAMAAEECSEIVHHDFHVLGRVVLNDEVLLKLQSIKRTNPCAFVSADANWLRARLGRLNEIPTKEPSHSNGFASRRAQAVAGLLAREMYG